MKGFGNLLTNPVVGSTVIEKGDVLLDHAPGMPFTQDQDMVQAFTPHRAEKTLTNRRYANDKNGLAPHQG